MEVCNKNDDAIVTNGVNTLTWLKCELNAAVDQIERGEYMDINEAFDLVIAQYAD
jgi:hypothetical protein